MILGNILDSHERGCMSFTVTRLTSSGAIEEVAGLYLAHRYYAAHGSLILQVPECCAGILAPRSGQDGH